MTVAGLALALLLAHALGMNASAQTSDPEQLLAKPVSPGTIAALANYTATPATLSRLESALKDQRPTVRAAAARVIFTTGASSLASATIAALRAETDISAATEEARVAAWFAGADAAVIEAWRRIGPDAGTPLLFALASARGLAGLDTYKQVRTEATDSALPTMVELVARREENVLRGLAAEAIRQSDRALFSAVLASADNRQQFAPEVVQQLIASGLESTVPQTLRVEAIWRALATWHPGRRLPAALQTGFDHILNDGIVPTDANAVLALGLVARAGGHEPADASAWTKALANPPSELGYFYRLVSIRELLTETELETLGRAAFGDAKTLRKPTVNDIGAFDRQIDAPKPAPKVLIRTLSGYPSGFVADIFTITRCDLADPQKIGVGEALLTLRPDGRVMNASLASTSLPSGCTDALRTLMLTYVVDIDRLPNVLQEHVLTPFDADFISCQDTYAATPRKLDAPGGRLEQPRKTKDVNPVYPPSAIVQRVQGTVIIDSVISPTGCVARAEIARQLDPRLDGAALRAVLGWRFTPTRVNGTAVPVIMTVSVAFTLK